MPGTGRVYALVDVATGEQVQVAVVYGLPETAETRRRRGVKLLHALDALESRLWGRFMPGLPPEWETTHGRR